MRKKKDNCNGKAGNKVKTSMVTCILYEYNASLKFRNKDLILSYSQLINNACNLWSYVQYRKSVT